MHHQPSYISPSVSPTDVLLAPVQALYDQGLFQQAFRAAESLGPLHSWRGTSGRLLAGRLARQLGADKLGNRQLLLAWRHDPNNWRARSFFLSTFAGMRGPVALWRRLNHYGNPPDDDLQSRADFCSLRARAAAALRDFDLADHWLNEAERAGLDHVWLASERSYRLELEDRYQEALEVAQQYLAEHPGHWLLQYRIAHTLQLLGRDDEALLLLRSSIPESESPFLGATLFALEVELRLYDDALRTLDWIETRVPLAEPEYRQWLAGNRAACLHYLDRRTQAAGWARQAGQDDFSKRFAERLENPPAGASRVELPVGFVRQHHLTCVPATLTTLGRFWGKPTEHLEVAEAICYDGTPGHSERNWASSNGWVAREFTVTLPAARSLLLRGVPFAFVTVYPANAHEQAVIGYDDFRESLLIRDPYYRNKSEFLAGTGLVQQAPSGPRGMAMVPMENVQLLDGLDLPDAELYDLHHKVLLALDRHDRQGAIAARQELETRAPGHRITFQSRQAIASYDANSHEQLAAVDGLRSLFPDDANLQLSRLQIMRTLARRDERLAMLREACASKKSDPLLWQELAGELALDAREHDVARRWLNRAERTRQSDAAALALRANMGWARGQFEEACQYYRFAACLNDKSEYFATTWFRASRWLKQTNEALRFLTHRFRRDGKRSSMPARTLVWAYMELNQPKEAFAVLEQALALRPDDGDLKLFACDQYTNSGSLERAETLLSEAKSRTTTGALARAAAAIANQRAELRPALDLWREVLAAEPLAMDAHRSIAYLLSETDSRTAALNYLASACERFPFYVPLHELRVTWLRDEGPDVYEPAVRALVEHVAESAWGRRELALALIAQDRFEESHAELDVASQLDPNDPWLFNVRGQCFARQGRPAEARAQFRESLQRTVDDTLAMRELLGQCETPEQRGDALNFIQGELIRQTTFGDGILEFADLARPFLAPEHLLLLLQQAQTERSDLWHAWSALISHLLSMKRSDEALALANHATEVFPLVPRLWLDLAQVHRARLDRPQQVTALEQALEISPNWSYASRQLAEALHGSNKMQEACAVLKQAIARSRQDPLNHGELAALLWQLGEKQAAVAELRECLLLEPGHEWAWSRLEAWGKETGQPDIRRVLAEELTERRPGEARSWWLLGIALNDPDQLDRSLACLDKAIDRNPRFVAAWRSRAAALAAAGRYDEALAACKPPELQPTPAELRAMSAWVLSERGDIPAAIREMRAVLEDYPNIEWGWRELATWHYNRGEYALAAKAADALSQMLPFDPVPLGFAAELKMHEGDRDGALKQFARAFEVDPSYTFAGFNLFRLQLENRDVEGARQTLARLRDQVREPAALEREIALEITAGNRNSIWPLLRRMCACSEDDPDSFDRLSAQLTQHKLVKQALPTVSEALRAEKPNDSVAWLWVDLRWAAGHFRNTEELLRLTPRSELGRRAFIRQLLAIGTKIGEAVWPWNPARRDFNRMMAAHREWFHSDDQLWGKVGYILVNQRRYNETIEWLQDWREHKQAEPWMLENLLLALQESGREEEVRILIRDARALPRHLGSLVRFDLFDALREAYTGNPDPGRHLLTLIDEKQLEPYNTSLVVFLRIALEFLSSESNTDFNRKKRRQLSKALDNTRNLKAGREAFQKITSLIADSTGKRWIRLWGKTHLLMRASFGF